MTDNIVSSIARSLTPEVVDKMAAAAGLDREAAHQTVGASVPAILNELVNVSQKPGGTREIVNALADQPASMLSNITASLSGSAPLADKGKALLSSILGGNSLSLLSSAVSRFTGTSEASTRTIMGLLAPIVLGTIGYQQRAQGLDASGVSRLLQDQKANIADALPAGLARLLPDTGTLNPIPASAAPASDMRPPIPSAAAINSMAANKAAETASRAKWPYWVLPLLALGGLAWYFLSDDRARQLASLPSTTTSQLKPGDLASNALPKSGYFSRPEENWISVSAIGNQDLYNKSGEKLGSVTDLLVGPDGRIAAAVVNVGSFLGIGEKRIAMPFSTLTVETRDGAPRLTVNAGKDAILAAPAFQGAKERFPNVPHKPTTRP
jgi:hypothetical protein